MSDTAERLEDLCASLRTVVLPSLGVRAARAHAGVALDERGVRDLALPSG